jgi:putative SOS response-associated peptidase YedK
MCGRYAFIPKSDFYNRFDIKDKKVKVGISYNIAPGAAVPVVTMNSPKQLRLMKWGLIPSWAKDPKIAYHTINARCEDIEKKPAYKSAFVSRRCLVPASGFYEWKKVSDEGKPVKIPYWISLKDRQMFGFAGIYENDTFSIITTQANSIMRYIHDRMPVILGAVDEEKWLDTSKYDLKLLKELMVPYQSEEMEAWRVAAMVNNPMNNDAELINKLN